MASEKAISANDQNNGVGQTIYGTDVSLGVSKPIENNSASQFIKGVESTDPWGNQAPMPPRFTHDSDQLRVTSPISGWTIDFAVDVGDGLTSVTTDLPDDHEQTGKGEFTYLFGNAGVNKDYNNLTS